MLMLKADIFNFYVCAHIFFLEDYTVEGHNLYKDVTNQNALFLCKDTLSFILSLLFSRLSPGLFESE